jgi:hypothetical protein
MAQLSLQQAALKRAIDLVGGVSQLGLALEVAANDLDIFMAGREATPNWLFLRVVDFLNEMETAATLDLRFPCAQGKEQFDRYNAAAPFV